MRNVIVHYHEIGLKGKNRGKFEDQLIRNIRAQLPRGSVKDIRRLSGRILVLLSADFGGPVRGGLEYVFGISSFAPAASVEPNLDAIAKAAIELYRSGARPATFAVRTKRSDKQFPITSDEVSRRVGAAILKHCGGKVDLENSQLEIQIEILSKAAYVMKNRFSGPGGLPVGVSGRVVAMLSGGIDSPVAAWKVMKRGCEVVFAHFHSYPHTSRASIDKVKRLAGIVGAYQPQSKFFLIPFAEAQRQVVMHTAPKYRVLLYRRLMMRIANQLAENEGAAALVTGESIGQVASQTLPNLRATEAASDRPVFRPLIGDDKEEIVTQAKKLGTYEISIEPHDDCCTLFIPKNPATRARIADLEREEARLDIMTMAHDTLAKINTG